MAGLRETVSLLMRGRRRFPPARVPAVASGAEEAGGLSEITGFGSNPGNLRMFAHVADGLAPNRPLVVVLHGCTQSAAYARAAGWTDLADELGIAVLAPEQQRPNNPNTCFNWFHRGDAQRDSGEAFSIWEMVEHMVVTHRLDRRRLYVTGLSAGGAMACALLAAYPDVFAAGAIIAGLPYRCADNVQQALAAMAQPRPASARSRGDLVRAASLHRGPWPRVAIWHGKEDRIVALPNADAIAQQWCDVHGLADNAFVQDSLDGQARRRWLDADGRTAVETIMIDGFGHGTPIDAQGATGKPLGTPKPFVIDIGVSSTRRIAEGWGLGVDGRMARRRPAGGSQPAEGAGRVFETAAHGALTALRKILPSGLLVPGSGKASSAVWTGEWEEEASLDGVRVHHGYASSGVNCVGGLHTKAMAHTFRAEPRQRLIYERRLHLHAGVNIFTRAAFRVTIDGATVDQESVVFANRMDHDWTSRAIDLGQHASRDVVVRFEVAADCNVCMEVFAKAWVRGLRIEHGDAAAVSATPAPV